MKYRLLNETRDQVLVEDLTIAKTPWAKMWGLLGKNSLEPETGLLIEFCNSIHMWFMQFPIDVVYLDRNLMVENIVHSLQPWGTSSSKGSAHVLEITAGQALAMNVSAQDQLKIEQYSE